MQRYNYYLELQIKNGRIYDFVNFSFTLTFAKNRNTSSFILFSHSYVLSFHKKRLHSEKQNRKTSSFILIFHSFALSLHQNRNQDMKANEQTQQQIERFINKIAQKFPMHGDEALLLTDIHIRVTQDSGEMLAFDDDDQEITRCVVEQWIENKDENFYDQVLLILRNQLKRHRNTVDNLGILKPFSIVLENDDKENIGELYLADDDTIIVSGDLMEGLDKELDDFFKDLMK